MDPQSNISMACRDELEKRIPNAPVIRHLVANGILTNTQKEKILECESNRNANKILLDELLVSDPYPFDGLRSALRAVGQYSILNILDSDQYADPNESDSPSRPENTEAYELFIKLRLGAPVQEFIQRFLKPDTSFQETCRKAFDIVRQRIQQRFKADPEYDFDIFQGGSCGKDTHVQDQSDVDVVVQLKLVETVQHLSRVVGNCVMFMTGSLTKPNNEEYTITVTKGIRNTFVVKLRLTMNHAAKAGIDIDLVPIANILKSCASDDIRSILAKIYSDMQEADADQRSLYSKCFSKLLIDFVKSKPEDVKDVIRLLKYWNDVERLGITPTCIELVVINEWDQLQRSDEYENTFRDELLCRSVKAFTGYSKLTIAWNVYYTSAEYTANLSGPYILDPTNPFNNLHHNDDCDPRLFNTNQIEKEARKLLAMLKGLGQSHCL